MFSVTYYSKGRSLKVKYGWGDAVVSKHACSVSMKTWVLIPSTCIQAACACNSNMGGCVEAGGSGELIGQSTYERACFWFVKSPCLMATKQSASLSNILLWPLQVYPWEHAPTHFHVCIIHTPRIHRHIPGDNCSHQANATLYNKSPIRAKCLIQTPIKYLMYVPNISISIFWIFDESPKDSRSQ